MKEYQKRADQAYMVKLPDPEIAKRKTAKSEDPDWGKVFYQLPVSFNFIERHFDIMQLRDCVKGAPFSRISFSTSTHAPRPSEEARLRCSRWGAGASG